LIVKKKEQVDIEGCGDVSRPQPLRNPTLYLAPIQIFLNDDIYNGVLIFKFLHGLRGQERESPRGSTSLCTSGSILFRAWKAGGGGQKAVKKIQLFFAQNLAAVHQVPTYSHALSCALNTWYLYFTCCTEHAHPIFFLAKACGFTHAKFSIGGSALRGTLRKHQAHFRA
jgi:hypothetical protein